MFILIQQLVEECDELWHGHCQAEFRGLLPDEEEDETWKELYVRSMQERDRKLKKITSTIGKKMAVDAMPGEFYHLLACCKLYIGNICSVLIFCVVRKTVKMDSFASGKMKNGRAQYAANSGASTSGKPNMASVKNVIHNARMAGQSMAKGPKSKTAPLMAKALQSMKSRFRR